MKNLKKSGTKSTKKIEYGNIELDTDEFSPSLAKERITIWLDEEVLNNFRERAKAEGTKYQSLVNQALREAVRRPSLVDRVENLEKKLGVG